MVKVNNFTDDSIASIKKTASKGALKYIKLLEQHLVVKQELIQMYASKLKQLQKEKQSG